MPKIAACLIVKDAADTIEKCLDSIRPFVDEINIYDTGSTDDTLSILERLDQGPKLHIACPQCVRLNEQLEEDGSKDICPEHGEITPVEIPLAQIRVEQGEWRDDFSWARQRSWEMVSDDVDW